MMNKRIRELAKQSYERRKRVIPNLPIGEAWIEFDAEGRPTNLPDELVFNKEKFAELIVKECAEVCRRQQYYDADDEYKRGVNGGSFTCMNAIRRHFGVEE